jgi:uncharacterized DUF497 family protein
VLLPSARTYILEDFAHTVDEDEEVIRILSARKAIRRESMYAQSN